MAVRRMFGFDEWSLLSSDTVPSALLNADGWTGSGGTVTRSTGRFGLGKSCRFDKGGSNSVSRYIPIGGRFSEGGGTWMFGFNSGNIGGDWTFKLYDSVTNTYPIGLAIKTLARVSPIVNNAATFTTFPGSVVQGQWHWFEVKWTSGTPGSDTAEFYIDGELIASYTSLTVGQYVDVIEVACNYFGSGTIDLDDMVLQDPTGAAPNNDLIGNVRVGAQWADGPGDLTEFSVTGAASNWQASLNVSLNTGIYVSTDVVGNGDLYNLIANVPARTIYGIQAKGVFQQTDATQLYGATIIKTGGTEFPGVNRGLASGIRSQWDNWDINPDTGVAWTNTDLAALQLGPYLGASD